MEGATLGLAYGLERFRAMGISPTEIRLTGGGSKSPVWRQIAADVFATPVVTLATAEGAGLGAAIQAAYCAAEGATSYTDLSGRYVALDESTRCEPSSDNVEVYKELLGKQGGLTRSLRDAGYL
jgi:xylulokinase